MSTRTSSSGFQRPRPPSLDARGFYRGRDTPTIPCTCPPACEIWGAISTSPRHSLLWNLSVSWWFTPPKQWGFSSSSLKCCAAKNISFFGRLDVRLCWWCMLLWLPFLWTCCGCYLVMSVICTLSRTWLWVTSSTPDEPNPWWTKKWRKAAWNGEMNEG